MALLGGAAFLFLGWEFAFFATKTMNTCVFNCVSAVEPSN